MPLGRKDAQTNGAGSRTLKRRLWDFLLSFFCSLAQRHNGENGQTDLAPALYLQLIGTSPYCFGGYRRDAAGALVRKEDGKRGRHDFHKHSPWAMSRVCRTVHAEVAPLLNSIDMADILFDMQQFTLAEMRRWVTLPSADRGGKERVKQMRQWSISTQGYCDQASFEKAKEERNQRCGKETDRDLARLGRPGFKKMGVADYCWRHIYVNFANYDPEPDWDDEEFDVVEGVYSADYCQKRSSSCEVGTERAIEAIWQKFDRKAWRRDDHRPPGLPTFHLPLVVAVRSGIAPGRGRAAHGRYPQQHVRDLDAGLGAERAAPFAGRGLVAGGQEDPDRVLDGLEVLGPVDLDAAAVGGAVLDAGRDRAAVDVHHAPGVRAADGEEGGGAGGGHLGGAHYLFDN
ncbi:hypothetical protein PG997_006479 [Apiospora hydei]|uniref:Uncharacterized protein n=1 Tax=Apiospora hydei TaxID=1337664 RepID=A0ABR1WP64_9PEZI